MSRVRLNIRGLTPAQLQGYGFAVASAVCYGGSSVLIREGVRDLTTPLVGTGIASIWGTLILLLPQAARRRQKGAGMSRGLLLFALAGMVGASGFITNAYALENADVVVVVPVSSINPLFTMAFAALLLQRAERVTRRLISGAALVVLGVIILSVASA